MLMCLLFHAFCELNKTAKLKGANMGLMFTGDLKLLVLELWDSNSPK